MTLKRILLALLIGIIISHPARKAHTPDIHIPPTKPLPVTEPITIKLAMKKPLRLKTPPDPRTIGQKLAKQAGWTGYQWEALKELWQRESGWDPTAQNPYSSAYGIAQFLNSTWGTVGCSKSSLATEQIRCGIKYIKANYVTPAAALRFWQNPTSPPYGQHWY